MDEVRSNTFYLTSDNDRYRFSEFIKFMKYENGKIIHQSPTSWPDTFDVRRDKNTYDPIGSIGSYFFKE